MGEDFGRLCEGSVEKSWGDEIGVCGEVEEAGVAEGGEEGVRGLVSGGGGREEGGEGDELDMHVSWVMLTDG